MSDITGINVTIRKDDLLEFLADTSDPIEAAEQYRAEYEQRLIEAYPDAEISVELGNPPGLTDRIMVEPIEEEEDAIPWIQDVANQMVNDWSWLTVA